MCRYTGRLVVSFSWSICLLGVVAAAGVGQRPPTRERAPLWAFTGPWDPNSLTRIRSHGSRLDGIVTGWIGLDSVTARPIEPLLFPDTVRPMKGTLRRMAIVTSWHGDRFHPQTVRRLARDRALLSRTAGAIAGHSATMRYEGLVLDFEALEAGDLSALLQVVQTITDSAHRRGVNTVAVAIPALDTAAYPIRPLLEVTDFVILMLYDQHWTGSAPGPIAAPSWVREALTLRVREAGSPARVVAGLPAYGYRWAAGRPGQTVSFAEARRIAAVARAPLRRDAATGTLRAMVPGKWEMWVTDAEVLAALVRQARSAGVRRFALWYLGQEDPAVWRDVFP